MDKIILITAACLLNFVICVDSHGTTFVTSNNKEKLLNFDCISTDSSDSSASEMHSPNLNSPTLPHSSSPESLGSVANSDSSDSNGSLLSLKGFFISYDALNQIDRRFQNENILIQTKLEDINRNYLIFGALLQEKDAKIADLEKEMENLRNKLQRLADESIRLRNWIQDLATGYEKVFQEKDTDNDVLKEEVKTLELGLQYIESERYELSQRISGLEDKNQQFIGIIKSMDDKTSDQEERIGRRDKQIAEQKSRVGRREDKIAELERENEGLKREITDLTRRLEETQSNSSESTENLSQVAPNERSASAPPGDRARENEES